MCRSFAIVNSVNSDYFAQMARYTETVFPVKKLVALTAEMARAIEDYRFANRVPSEAEAIRRLIERGLAAEQPPQAAPGRG